MHSQIESLKVNIINYNDMRERQMKKIILLFVLVSSLGFAQGTDENEMGDEVLKHKRFYLSLAVGPTFGKIKLYDTGPYPWNEDAEFSGAGIQYDLKTGYTISEEHSLILSFDIVARTIPAPTITMASKTAQTGTDFNINDYFLGMGITKYFMPVNIFISASVGSAGFSIDYKGTGRTSLGLALQFKVGKEWWIGDEWGLGLAAGVGYSTADDATTNDITPKLSTTRFFVTLSITYN